MKLSGPLALSEKEARLPATSLVIQSFRWTPPCFSAIKNNSGSAKRKAPLPEKEEGLPYNLSYTRDLGGADSGTGMTA